tara:strand:- start:395 stop:538 length:144 start_codon:yes stop_codon:yes gene_type:complete
MPKLNPRMLRLLVLGFLDSNALEDFKLEKKFKLKKDLQKVVNEKCVF